MAKTPKKDAIRTLAEQIATDLFTNGANEKADRLVLMHEPNGTASPGRNLGGLCFSAAVGRIEKILRAELVRKRPW